MDFQIFFLKENSRIYDRAELMTFLASNPNITPPNLKENVSKREYIFYHQTLNFVLFLAHNPTILYLTILQ